MDENTRCIVAATLAAGILATSKTELGSNDKDIQSAVWTYVEVLKKVPQAAHPKTP